MSIILSLALSLAGAAPAPIRAPCSLDISFSSYGAGIDAITLRKTEQLLKRDRGVATFSRRNWGREGEANLCVYVKKPNDTKRVFDRVRSLLPRKPRGPITVTAAGGLQARAPAK